jgi:cysteine desulfurase
MNSSGDAMLDRVYLDWNATAPLRAAARTAMLNTLDLIGNPSSIHAEGRAARAAVETAREAVARLVSGGEVTFTSGGTEANAMALTPRLEWRGGKACDRLLVSAIEHVSVLAGGQFPKQSIELIPVTSDGVVDLAALAERLDHLSRDGVQMLVSVMLANNETGVIQPVAAAAELAHRAGGLLHVDAVQAAGKMSIDLNALGADLVSVSAHKLGGPKGIGALVRRRDIHLPEPPIRGGGQERGLRAGTENVAAIAGFGAAAAEAAAEIAEAPPATAEGPTNAAAAGGKKSHRRHLMELRHRLEIGLADISRDVTIFGAATERLPNTSLFAVPGLSAETALIALDLAGIAASSGSACSSGKVTPSHVLAAMGIGRDLASGAIRVSTGPTITAAEIDRFLEAWRSTVARLNKSSKKVMWTRSS